MSPSLLSYDPQKRRCSCWIHYSDTQEIILAQSMERSFYFYAILLVAAFLLLRREKMVWRVAPVNGKAYYVKNVSDAKDAANHLATLESRVSTFLKKGEERDKDDPRLVRIKERWTGTLSEVPPAADNVAYSIGKTSIHICVREKNGRLTDLNTSLFVLIHELAHVATTTIGHTNEFWKNMKYLLELAEEVGVYTYVDHDETTESLCGRVLGTNPLTCVKEKTCASERSGK